MPTRNANKNPNIDGKTILGTIMGSELKIAPITSNIIDAIIIGIESKNENLLAFSLLLPHRIAVHIVAPLLEIPGKTAIPCANPIIKAELLLISLFTTFVFFCNISVNNNSIAVVKKQTGRNPPENAFLKKL